MLDYRCVGRDLIPPRPTSPGHGYPSIPTKVDTDAFQRLEEVVRRLTLGDETAEPELAKAWKKLRQKRWKGGGEGVVKVWQLYT